MPVVSGKGNRTRKTLSFFGVNFGLSPPYDVLCDGPIIFQSLKNDLYLKQSLPKLLGAPAYPVVTECVVKELRRLGEDFTNAALFAKRAKRVPCVHNGKVDVAECLLSRLRNPSHTGSVLATNDPEVSKKATRVPGVAIVSILNQKKLVLQAPSLETVNYVKRSEKTKTHNLSESDRALVQEVKAAENRLRSGRVVKKKRKRAKGPNPLSVKKSKENDRTNVGGVQGASALLEISTPNKDSRSNKAQETNLELEDHESSFTATPNKGTGSPDVTSGESKRKRKRRRVTKPYVESGLRSDDAVNGMEKARLSQRADNLSENPRIQQTSNQVGKREHAIGSANAITKQLPSASQTTLPHYPKGSEQIAPKDREAPALTNTHSETQPCQEKQCNKASFNEGMSNTCGDMSASAYVAKQLPLTSRHGGESKEDSGAPQDELADEGDSQLAVMHRTEAEEKVADMSSHAKPGENKTKKHRKNRRRRPKKKTST